jgi:hypothetical protein
MTSTSSSAVTSTYMAISGAMTTSSALASASMAAGAAVDVPALGGMLGGMILLAGLL